MLFRLLIQFSIYHSVIMVVALIPDQAIFDNISLARIGNHFMSNL